MRAMCVVMAGLLWASTSLAWEISESEDEMTGKKQVVAYVRSSNFERFEWPYHGDTYAWLTVRKHPRFGQDVFFQITRGQITCRSIGCTVLVRFDDRSPIKFAAIGPEDNDSRTVFFNNSKKFVAELRKAKRARVAATVHREGTPVFEFDTAGFDLK